MSTPTAKDILAAMQATWPPAACQTVGNWTIRQGRGGGRRVSAATGQGDIKTAQAAMSALNQPPLFMIRDGDAALDAELDACGYTAQAPTTAYCCPIRSLTADPVPPRSAFTIWPPLAIMDEFWLAGGIGPERQAVMARVAGPKTAILGRTDGHASGTGFIAIHNNIAMIYAVEVTPTQRRKGTAINIMRAAAHWAQDQGARHFGLLVTDANTPANALYKKLGLTVVGHYHYRIRQQHQTTKA